MLRADIVTPTGLTGKFKHYLNSQMVLPVVGQGFVEFGIFLSGDVVRVTSPQWLDLVQFLLFCVLLFDGLLLLLLLSFVIFLFFIQVLDLGLVLILLAKTEDVSKKLYTPPQVPSNS